ncbi:MAG: diguanylate cyclase, partial [bacterium]|nr:diguanylate cyclase [bacterium]
QQKQMNKNNIADKLTARSLAGYATELTVWNFIYDIASQIDKADKTYGQISLDNQFDRLNFYDPQTKLPSYSYFSMKVKDEIKRCDRYRLTCSMVIFSIHPDVSDDMRDRIMENFGEVLRTKYREGIDIPTRLNESSVLLIAPETPKDKAVVLAQRMQYATAALGMLTPSGHPVRTVCAVGSYPECADTGDELLNRLISALDIAKVMDTGICVCGSSNK